MHSSWCMVGCIVISMPTRAYHQPLTFALGNRNFNAKLKRWKARIEEYNHELFYKPGRTNYFADALSRLKTKPQLYE